jgi:hypothetical protein
MLIEEICNSFNNTKEAIKNAWFWNRYFRISKRY